MSRRFLSPLRYPGSKRRLAHYIEKTLTANNFFPKVFIEPFAGGASIALHFLQNDLAQKIIIADLDPWIASFWKTVFWDTEWLIKKIEQTSVTLDEWNAVKERDPVTQREQAWACLFLNRTSFSGILRPEVGPLGGRKQNSPYTIDCRFPRQTLIARILRISSFRDRIYAVWNLPWEATLESLRIEQKNGKLPTKDLFFYFDPPFFEKADALYRYYFQDADHRALRDALLNLKDKWLLSYDSAEQVESLYGPAVAAGKNGAKRSNVELLYSLSLLRKRKRGKEVIISNLDLLPEFNGHR